MKWKEFTYQQVIEFCNSSGSRTFSLQGFLKQKRVLFQEFRPANKNIDAKVRQQLQFLRDDGLISFLDNSGHYTLRGVDLLQEEIEETSTIDLSNEVPEKREYVIETYVRNVAWAKKARDVLGAYCLFRNCDNTFLREDGTPYIEVHHIIPLCDGGEDGLWNLSVVCAHHHKMAHYSNHKTKMRIQNYLLEEVKCRL